MGKLIAAFNMTLDGFCDHTTIVADDQVHDHYKELLQSARAILFGRVTYQLMEYWHTVVQNPTGNRATDEFAFTLDSLPKVVFSNTLQHIDWKTATLAKGSLEDELQKLRKSPHRASPDILVGSRSLILQYMNLNLIDELQLCIQPIIASRGLPLFENMTDRIDLELLKTKTFHSGAVIHYYRPAKK